MTNQTNDAFDAAIIGGGPAGLSAALALGRATCRVLVLADGPPRNAPAEAAHNVFTRDGTPPAELLRIGLAQLEPYDVTVRREWVRDVARHDDTFALTLTGGATFRARGLVLACGVRDVLPHKPGFQELWGRGVYHCPYCHGWEVAGQPLGVYGKGEIALHLARLLRGWTSDLVLFTDGPAELGDEERARIVANGIVIREEPVARLTGDGPLTGVVLEGGETVPRTGLFIKPKLELRSDLPHRLGCQLNEQGRVEADKLGRTNVPGVYVAGDAGPNAESVIVAAATGAMAGAALNLELLQQEFESRAAVVRSAHGGI